MLCVKACGLVSLGGALPLGCKDAYARLERIPSSAGQLPWLERAYERGLLEALERLRGLQP
jgi:hypothetical protein